MPSVRAEHFGKVATGVIGAGLASLAVLAGCGDDRTDLRVEVDSVTTERVCLRVFEAGYFESEPSCFPLRAQDRDALRPGQCALVSFPGGPDGVPELRRSLASEDCRAAR